MPFARARLAAFVVPFLLARPAASAEPDAEVARRLAFIEQSLERGERPASIWWHTWYGSYLALTVGQGVIAGAVTDRGLRADMAVGAVSTALGVASLGLFDFPARYAGSALRAMPARTPAERRAKLLHAEKLLRESAEAEDFGRSWISHLLVGGVAAASGVVLAAAYKRGANALVSVATNLVVGELQIWTQPMAASRAWEAYKKRSTPLAPTKAEAPRLSVAVAPGQGGAVGMVSLVW